METKRLVLFSLGLFLVLGFAHSIDITEADLKSDDTKMALYDKWRAEFKKPDPSLRRENCAFSANMDLVVMSNKQNMGFKLKLNKFADLSNEEFKTRYCGTHTKHGRTMMGAPGGDKPKGKVDAPPTVDWRTQNAVTPVRDQGECPSDWAIAITGSVESLNAIKTKQLVTLSPQELLDCDRELTNKGCDGGVLDHGFQYVKMHGGLAAEDAYPYTGADGTCNQQKVANKAAKIDGYKDVFMDCDNALMKAVSHQPVAVVVDAPIEFQLYGEGIFTGACGKTLVHGMLVVGYDDAQKFWIVKSSWGEDWGEGGYIRLQKNAPYPEGMCGILQEASYPIINDGSQPAKEEF
ncbi:LOW QUALITY PROTEIN: hypothetical protein OSB04_005078 [Centaurea solstitialis]|uniref:Uncharacterized protein n=1 Tax=Centaurea solstitialis TaxID=347529 RepID=A0AA38TFA7_9ASTR|nr:LOW QUALITY PROTEIN: hypothetical protein OSB04_005078 [Centaurea solstitialis]